MIVLQIMAFVGFTILHIQALRLISGIIKRLNKEN